MEALPGCPISGHGDGVPVGLKRFIRYFRNISISSRLASYREPSMTTLWPLTSIQPPRFSRFGTCSRWRDLRTLKPNRFALLRTRLSWLGVDCIETLLARSKGQRAGANVRSRMGRLPPKLLQLGFTHDIPDREIRI